MTTKTRATARPARVRTPDRQYPGPDALFRPKVRKPVTMTLTKPHHEIVKRNQKRLALSRADYFGLLLEQCGDSVQLRPEHLVALGRA